jgi:phosphoribosylformylglycinamidine (FGAM) synthase-like amidotransferase family enzyme
MPHPERAMEAVLGSEDGRVLVEGFVASLERRTAGV